MENITNQNKLLALALYEIRQALASNLGSQNEADISTRVAAHLAYALHNEALAIMEGKSFDIQEALKKVQGIDNVLGEEYSSHFISQYNECSA